MDIRMTVKRIIDKEGRNIPRFKDNLPGKDWMIGLLKRHKNEIKDRMSQNISKVRAKVDANSLEKYFSELAKSLDGIPAANIINYDETNLTDDPGRKKFIFKRGYKYPERIINSTKSSTSLMLAGSGAGELLPIYVVYKAEHLWTTWTDGGPDKTRYNRSKSGRFDQVCFEDWFRFIALPFCKRLEGRKVLIGDNLSSPFSDDVLDLCKRNNIVFICLPPNATHLYQHIDVAFFGPMKTKWRQILTIYKMSKSKQAGTLQKDVFPNLLKQLMEELSAKASDNLQAGFKKCGICPVSAEPVLQRLPSTCNASNDSVSEAFTEQLRFLREGEPGAPRRSRRRLDVVPGRSVAGMGESESSETTTAGPSNTRTTTTQDDSCSSSAESDPVLH